MWCRVQGKSERNKITMKIGLLGGTFNPIHLGHLALAQEAWHVLKLDKVIFIPANRSPFKENIPLESKADRLDMLRLALEGEERFKISTFELDKEGLSYSVDTIKHFKDEYGKEAELFFITGADSLRSLNKWKGVDKLLKLATFVVATRPGFKREGKLKDKVELINIPAIDISSTMIRERVLSGEPIDQLVPPQVATYIEERGLYRE
jgi:nicotinate-nucleotide adenylyltransferase